MVSASVIRAACALAARFGAVAFFAVCVVAAMAAEPIAAAGRLVVSGATHLYVLRPK